jgi:hypothetical protein
MTSTFVDNIRKAIKNRADVYRFQDDELVRQIRGRAHTEAPHSRGGVLSIIRHLAIRDIAISQGKVLNHESLKEMWTPVRLNDGSLHPYGFGWQLTDFRGHRKVSQGG